MRHRYEEEMSSSTPSSYSSLTIVCVRSVDKESGDDLITIRPYMSSAFEQMYSVTHRISKDHSPKEYQVKTTTEMTADGLLTYIDSLLDLLYYDEDPFEGIQFDIPNLPSIFVKPKNIDLVKDRVLTFMKALVNSTISWPMNSHIYRPSVVESEVHVKKEKKNKHHKQHKQHPCYSETVPVRDASQYSSPTREHLFFDEDNNISSYYYDI